MEAEIVTVVSREGGKEKILGNESVNSYLFILRDEIFLGLRVLGVVWVERLVI